MNATILNRSQVTTRKQQLSREQINIKREVEYIVRRATERDARVVLRAIDRSCSRLGGIMGHRTTF